MFGFILEIRKATTTTLDDRKDVIAAEVKALLKQSEEMHELLEKFKGLK